MTKRVRIGMVVFGVVLSLLFGVPSFAASVNIGDTVQFSFAPNHASGFPGGAFLAKDLTSGTSWLSFCLEHNEYITLGANYRIDTIGPDAVGGGVGNSGTPGVLGKTGSSDPISSQTAYLYYRYATGGIPGVSGAGTGAQQQALQNVFWYLENEIFSPPGGALFQQYLAIAQTATEGQHYDVFAVNPNTLAGTRAQSQLVYLPVSVPEAGTLLLFGSGLVGLVGYRRVRRMQ